MSPAVATYLYCIVQSAAPPPSPGESPEGLPETGPPRLVPLGGGLWLAVGDAPLPDYSGEEIERRLPDLAWVSACAVAHERVVAHFAARGPAVPMKLFTLFESDARAAEALAGQRERLEAVLAKVVGCREWGVRVSFDPGRAKLLAGAASRERPAAPSGAESGRDFLRRKKEAQEAARTVATRAGAAVEETFAALSGKAVAARRREPLSPPEGPKLLLDAAFLVREERAEEFERAVGGQAEGLAGAACELTLTGPWPPYNFIDEEAAS